MDRKKKTKKEEEKYEWSLIEKCDNITSAALLAVFFFRLAATRRVWLLPADWQCLAAVVAVRVAVFLHSENDLAVSPCRCIGH